jgi:hypothetical protein
MTSWMDDEDQMTAGVADDSLDLGFTADEVEVVERSNDREPLPAGTYEMQVIDLKATTTKDGQMSQIVVTLEVPRDGREHQGRRVWARHTRATRSDDAGKQTSLRIGRERLAELMLACGEGGSNVGACLGQVVNVKLKVRPASGSFSASNDVAEYVDGAEIRRQRKAAGEQPATAKPSASKPATPTAKPSTKPAFMQRKPQ